MKEMKKILKRFRKMILIGGLVLVSTGFLAFKSDFFEVAKQMVFIAVSLSTSIWSLNNDSRTVAQ